MKKQIDSKAMTFRFCPAFNYESIINTLNRLPNKIDKNSKFYKSLYTNPLNSKITLDLNINSKPRDNKKAEPLPALKQPKGSVGCASFLFILPALTITLYL